MPANLINPQAIDAYLNSFLPDQPEAQKLLKLALAKPLARRSDNLEELRTLPADAPAWLQKKWPEGGPYHRFHPDRALDDKVRHVADWIAAAVNEHQAWVERFDPVCKKPHRFNNIQSLDDAYAEADKDMRERNRKLARELTPDGDGEKTVMALGDGFRVVQLLTPAALDREGVKMGHCIGQGAYDEALEDGSHMFFSLRDAAGEPHATLEVNTAENALLQCQGKENRPPVAKYLPHLARFIEQQRYRLDSPACNTGLVESQGRYYSIFDLPKGLTVEGYLDLSGTPITSLPEGLTVGGSLYLDGTDITCLPPGLTVGGGLYLFGTGVNSLSPGLTVGDDLYLRNTPITSLPPGLTLRRNLDLANTPITSLPPGLTVGGELNLSGTSVREIPPDAQIGGPIYGFPNGMAEKYAKRGDGNTRLR